MSATVKLVGVSGTEYVVDRDVISVSITIKNMIEGLNDDSPIVLSEISNDAAIGKVIQYCEYIKRTGQELVLNKDTGLYAPKVYHKTDTDLEWEKKFVDVDQSFLFEMILAANYLNIKQMIDLTCKTVADMIKGKTVEQIRTLFQIPNDFTPEQEAAIRKENEWIDD